MTSPSITHSPVTHPVPADRAGMFRFPPFPLSIPASIIVRMAQGGPGKAGEPTFNEGARFSRQRRQTTRRIDDYFGPQSARSSFSRGQLPGKSRKYAVTDRSDSLELSCATRVHEWNSIMDRIAACAEKVSRRNVK